MEASSSRYTFSRSGMHSSSMPSPPSPAASSPTLTQSASNSSSSPPQPTTPPRQPRPRYPDPGRVPLHRRGTSNTYERLEDLLREAGYKETRIFTPESDKHGVDGRDDDGDGSRQTGGKKQGVGAAVVGFLTGLVTGTGAGNHNNMGGGDAVPELRQDQAGDDDGDDNPGQPGTQSPLSPLANKSSSFSRRDGSRSAESSEPQTPFMTSSIESLNDNDTPKAYRRQASYSYAYSRSSSRPTTPSAAAYHHHQYHASTSSSSYVHQHQQQPQQQHHYPHHRLSAAQLRQQASQSSINAAAAAAASNNHNATAPYDHQGTSNTNTVILHNPRPSRAGNYLRHMISTPTRPNSTPAHASSRRKDVISSSDVESKNQRGTEPPPPLPRNWLDNVARAILFGVAGTSMSNVSVTPPPGPNDVDDPPPLSTQKSLRPTRSSLSQTTIARVSKGVTRRSGLSDQTNTIPPLSLAQLGLAPPALFTRLERGRASCSQGVLKAQVVCRSAPGSRASSLVRGHGARDREVGVGRDNKHPRKRHHHHHHHHHRRDNGKDSEHRGRQTKKPKHSSSSSSKKKKNNNKLDEQQPRVPSLARTRIENDSWHTHSHSHHGPPPPPQSGTTLSDSSSYTSPPLPSPSTNTNTFSTTSCSSSCSNSETEYSSSDEEEEGEGELTLAKMLIPSKRQHSIRSLRKLHHHHCLQTPTPPLPLPLPALPTPPPSSTTTQITSPIPSSNSTSTQGKGLYLNPSLSRLRISSSSSTLRPPSPSPGPAATGAGGNNSSGRAAAAPNPGRITSTSSSQRSTTKSRLGIPPTWDT